MSNGGINLMDLKKMDRGSSIIKNSKTDNILTDD